MAKKNIRKKLRKSRKKSKRCFGKQPYGLQGPDKPYTGIYPMNMEMMGITPIFPNLYNVKRPFMAA